VPARKPKRPKRKRSIGKSFEKLVAIQARLRGPGGCPWDREQTHESLRPFLLEETYEVLDALEGGDPGKFSSELGDLLLQVVFHAELARESGRFDMGDVIEAIHAKLVRRHPHVFGSTKARTSKQVLKNWEQLKAEEREAGKGAQAHDNGNPSILDGVPRSLPALLEAYQLTRRASNIGFDWEDVEGLVEKLEEESAEVRRAVASAKSSRKNAPNAKVEEEAGDLLFVAVNLARFLGVDPEIALKKANRKFAARFQWMEQELERQGRRLAEAPREEMESLWEQAKGKV
jgi:MazG family protein